jgi:hypothetical protein
MKLKKINLKKRSEKIIEVKSDKSLKPVTRIRRLKLPHGIKTRKNCQSSKYRGMKLKNKINQENNYKIAIKK